MPQLDSKHMGRLNLIINIFYILIVIVLVYLFAKYLLGWLTPFIIGFILAAIIQPVSKVFSQKLKIKQGICAVILVLLLIVLLLGFLYLLTLLVIKNIDNITYFLSSLIDSIKDIFDNLSIKCTPFLNDLQSTTGFSFNISESEFSNKFFEITKLPDFLMKTLQSLISGAVPLFLNIVITVVASCFIAADFNLVLNFLKRLIPKRHLRTVKIIKEFFIKTIFKLIRAYALLMFITFCELSLGLFIIGIENPLGIALLIAVVDILPVLGTGTIMIPWGIIELLLSNTFLGIALLLLYVIITIVRNILEPKIVGNHIGLHPLVTLTAIIIGLKSLGLLGVIIFPITILVLKELYAKGIIKIPAYLKD